MAAEQTYSNIVSKTQATIQNGVTFNGTLNTGYSLQYNYKKPHQLDSLGDANYRTEGTAAKETIQKNNVYRYDADGNLIYVNTQRYRKDGSKDSISNERKLLWDEEDRLLAVDDNGYVSNYWYDAGGNRTVKTSGESEQMYVLGTFSGGRTNTADFTLYVNPYMVVGKGGRYTKHIYIGSERIVSKLGDLGSFGADPRRVAYAGANTDVAVPDYKAMYNAEQAQIKARYDTLDVPYNGTNNDDYVNGAGFCCNADGSTGTASTNSPSGVGGGGGGNITGGNDNPEKYQYYYHSDHLGSTSYITNLDGEVSQHVEYMPFGEVFLEERDTTWNTPYKFNGKELDEETGLYYYGARYYDPRTSLWLSTDPLAEKYPGVSPYAYCVDNPVILIDKDGMDWVNKANKKVEVTQDKNGKILLGENSYHDLRKIVRMINKSGSKTAADQFMKVANDDTKSHLKIASGRSPDPKFRDILYGYSQPLGENGKFLDWDNSKNEWYDKESGSHGVCPIFIDKNGILEYQEVRITLYKGLFNRDLKGLSDEYQNFATGFDISNFSKSAGMVSIFAHETEHQLDQQALGYIKSGYVPPSPYRIEDHPTKDIEYKVIQEITNPNYKGK